jgi:alanine racemase
MDMLMVDLGPAEEQGIGASIAVGDMAVLWGPVDEDDDQGQVRLQDLAETVKTTQSALTCGLDKIRVRRQFV